VLRFHDAEIEIVDNSGEKWVPVKALAKALGYSHVQQLHNLVKRNFGEFLNKTSLVKLTKEQLQPVMIINYQGVIRAAMLSDAPRAVAVAQSSSLIAFSDSTNALVIWVSDKLVRS